MKTIDYEKVEKYKALVEVHLHKLLCNYLDGVLDEAKKNLETLRKINVDIPQSFCCLNKIQIKRLQNIGYALDNNITVKNYNVNIEKEKVNEGEIKEEAETEKKLVKMITRDEKQLQQILKMPRLKIFGTEKQTEYGNVDIFARTNKYALPIEVKKGKADFKIVAQIDKYINHFLKMTHYKIWEDVIGVTIALDYDNYALKELKRNGIKILTYSVNNNKLILKGV